MKKIVFRIFIPLCLIFFVLIAIFIFGLKDTSKSKSYELNVPLKSDPYNIFDVENEISEYICKYSYGEEMILDYVVYSISKKGNSYAEFNYVSDDSKGIMTTAYINVTAGNISDIYCNKCNQTRSMSKGVQYVDVYEIYNNILSDNRYSEIIEENDPIRIIIEKDEISIMNMIYEDK